MPARPHGKSMDGFAADHARYHGRSEGDLDNHLRRTGSEMDVVMGAGPAESLGSDRDKDQGGQQLDFPGNSLGAECAKAAGIRPSLKRQL